MAFGAILGQSGSAENITYDNTETSSIISAQNVQQAIDQLFTSVSNGKEQIAVAITDKGIPTAPQDSFSTMASNISNIQVGINTDDADATAENIDFGKTAYVKGEKITGTSQKKKIITYENQIPSSVQPISSGAKFYYKIDGGLSVCDFYFNVPVRAFGG